MIPYVGAVREPPVPKMDGCGSLRRFVGAGFLNPPKGGAARGAPSAWLRQECLCNQIKGERGGIRYIQL